MTVRPRTLGDLTQTRWAEAPLRGRSIRDEIRANLLQRLGAGEPLFPGIVGFDDTVVPQIVNALLARHDFILLGTRGQAKSRILLRGLAGFLDDAIPIIAGSEINDDPFAPISKYGRERLEECGDATPIAWVSREQRYVEKLATPDVTIADIIGDVDPIKAARGGHVLADELTMHFGLLPRANRGIFAINELPDLSGKIQVGIVQHHAGRRRPDQRVSGPPAARRAAGLHRQPRGLHRPRQDHHAAQGPDRLGDHAPITPAPRAGPGHHRAGSVARARRTDRRRDAGVHRRSWWSGSPSRRGRTSGSTGAPASASGCRSRSSRSWPATPSAAASGAGEAASWRASVTSTPACPVITGKLELEYEGELQGGDTIARELIRQAAARVFDAHVESGPEVEEIVGWFDQGGALKVAADERAETCWRAFGMIPGLLPLVRDSGLAERGDHPTAVAACELVLEALAAKQRISRSEESGWQRARTQRRKPGYGEGENLNL